MQQHNTFTHPFISQKPLIQQATPIPPLSSSNLLLNNLSGYNQYPTASPLYQSFENSRPSIPSAIPLVTNRLNGHHSYSNIQNASATTISPPSSYSIPATAIAANTFATSPSATTTSSSTLNGFLSKPILSQQQVITLTIYRTTFNTKRSVELVQSSLQYKTHTRINIVRGKTGKVEISGKAPNVFEVGLFILEEIILRQRPVLWPLIMFSFWQNQSLEYMFFPCGEGDCKFQPKSFNETSLISQTSEQTLQQYQQPIIFLKKISIPSQNTLLQQFLQQNHTQSTNAASIWRLNAIKYSSHGSSLVQSMTRYNGEGNSQQSSNRRSAPQTTQQSQQQPIIPTVRIDSQHAVLLFAGTLQQVQEVHHKYIAAALGSLNDLKLVESFNILQTKQPNSLSSLSSTYNPQQVLSFQYSPSSKKLLINPSSVPSLAIMLPAEGLDLNEGYDECKSKGHHRSSATLPSPSQFDKRFEKLLLALQHSEVGKQLLHQGAASSGGMFVMMRDSFHKIANTRYMDDPKNAFEIQIYRENGVIYLDSHIIHLANVSSSVAHQLQLSSTGVVDKLTYHNNKFVELSVVSEDSLYSLQNLSLSGGSSKESATTTKSSNTCSDTSFPIIGDFEKYCTVVSSKLGSHNLLIAGQVDAASATRSTYQSEPNSNNVTVVNSKPVYDLSNYLEIKTCGSLEERDKDHYKRETLLSLFILSYSIGIQKIIGGYVDRDKKGTLKKVEVKKLPDLVQEADGLWEPEEVLTFVEQVLSWIKANTKEGKHYTMVFAPPSSHVVLLENAGATKSVNIK